MDHSYTACDLWKRQNFLIIVISSDEIYNTIT